MAVVRHKAAIHSGHFMVSNFEPDEQDEEDAVVPPGEEGQMPISALIEDKKPEEEIGAKINCDGGKNGGKSLLSPKSKSSFKQNKSLRLKAGGHQIRFSLSESKDKEISLTTLFKSMSIAYRQRLTSPRWNRFRGLKLRWKDKIRMNNVIWRCWHMQFMKNDSRSLCVFANPMEIDNHNRMEGTTLLEGKYWKRKLETIQKEYAHWRKFYYNQQEANESQQNHTCPEGQNCSYNQTQNGFGTCSNATDVWDAFLKSPNHQLLEGTRDDVDLQSMLNDEGMIVDLLLNTFQESSSAGSELSSFFTAASSSTTMSNMSVAVPFPNPRDYYKTTTNADLLQPGLGPLQPNLDEMDVDLEDLGWVYAQNQQQPIGSSGGLGGKNINAMTQAEVCTKASLDLLTAVVTATTANSMPATTSTSGGGKQRSMLAHQQAQDSSSPYPTTSPHKSRSPKQRAMLQLESTSTATATSSPLVQLLKSSPSAPPPTVKAEIQPHQPAIEIQQNYHYNGYNVGIPPPLATDYQQHNPARPAAINGNGSFRGASNTPHYAEHRRSVHINAEANRRSSIKHGFEELRSLIPALKDVPPSSHKISKAALLHKGGDHIRSLRTDIESLKHEALRMKENIEAINMQVSGLQGSLPALKVNGFEASNQINSILRQRKSQEDVDKLSAFFNAHVTRATAINWKYWAFSRIMKPMFESYTDSIAGTASFNEVDRCIGRWLEDKCSLLQMRQSTVTSLKNICVGTNILRDPQRMPVEALELAKREQEENL